MKKRIPLFWFLMFAAFLQAAALSATAENSDNLKIALIGDSTVCNYKESESRRGWGQMLTEYLADDVGVLNFARSGASTKTFPDDRWQQVLQATPDFVLIQFGHNDSHDPSNPESTDAATDYRDNLRRYIREAWEAGIKPVLVTPVRRRLFHKNGEPTSELAPYADAMKVVAAEMDVSLIDLHADSGALFSQLGERGSDDFTINKLDTDDRPGQGDRTHFTETGAKAMAQLVAHELQQLVPALR
jgi:lysophospholipase L1-like esterase